MVMIVMLVPQIKLRSLIQLNVLIIMYVTLLPQIKPIN